MNRRVRADFPVLFRRSLATYAWRTRIWLIGLVSALALAPSSFATAKPNILLLIADDYGADSSSLYNSTKNGAVLPPTPNIASIAANGVVFSRAYANPLCSPTRACLLTGRFGFRTGIGDVVQGSQAPLSANEFTLPRAFSTNVSLGYQLAHFGKWHLANGANTPLTVGGWPHYVGNLGGQLTNFFSWQKTSNGVTSTCTNYATTDLVNDAGNWISARGTNPWFLWAAFNAPHTPLHLPPTNLCPHYANLSGTSNDIFANQVKYFDAAIEALDTEIGRLLSALPERSNTHIIFLGDNGTAGPTIQPPFSGTRAKNTLYEGGTHVPLVISGPAVVNPGRTNDTLVSMVDIYATILEMAGSSITARAPAGMKIDSQSLMPALQTTNAYARLAYSELFGAGVNPQSATGRALRNSRYKLIRFNNLTERFYDLENDPYESADLLASNMTDTAKSNYFGLWLKLAGYQIALPQPVISMSSAIGTQFSVTVTNATNLSYTLWRAALLDDLAWLPVTNATITTNGPLSITLSDPGATNDRFFYRAIGTAP